MSRRRTIVRLSAVLAVVALAKGCGDGDSPTAPPTPEPARPTTVTVSPATDELTALGETVQLTAEVRDQNARVMAGATVTWTSSAISVATVDASGLVTAAGNGEATVTASAGEASGSAVVTVMQSVASVVVSPATAELTALGETVQLTAEAFDENGHAVAGAEFSWESSDVAVATVDALGLVRGVAEGTATIRASAGSAQGTAEILVGPNQDRAALIALYEATDGPNWVDAENWLTDAPLGDWYGVDADDSGRVVGLSLDRNNLEGSMPTELGSLASLTRLELWQNNLTGPIPPELGNLTSLEWLWLFNNELTGSIPPELGNLISLTRLELWQNNLTGPIPPELSNLTELTNLELGINKLTGSIPAWLGNLTSLESLWFPGNNLSGSIPPELGNLTSLTKLWLGGNNLTGSIPTELGSLARLEDLMIGSNDLTGPIPESFLQIDGLTRFHFERNADLCAPGTSDFVTWLQDIPDVSPSPYCNESDMEVLELVYETSGGPNWVESSGWLETPALEAWHGVTANSLGQVVALDLARNGLMGRLPANLGSLADMTTLRVGGNALSGPLPRSLAQLSLVEFHYADTHLCAPAVASFRVWLNGIASLEGTGVECAPPSDREILVALYEATDGRNWAIADNWLTVAPLGNWYGVWADARGRVTGLSLSDNELAGPIPAELGDLAALNWLTLSHNNLSGPIPPELGNLPMLDALLLSSNNLAGPIPPEFGRLTRLTDLWLQRNNLSGRIPSELGNLASLGTLNLYENDLSGPIPPELGNLANLNYFTLMDNALSGPIPPELGDLTRLQTLYLENNDLSGPIPRELGSLTNLESLRLDNNDLTGPVPPEFGGMSSLRRLSLTNNSGMSGALPAGLTALRLEALLAGGTDLCAPPDPGFQAWLEGVHRRRVAACAKGDPPMAYVTQAVQSQEYPVPLVAGEKALLRVFVTAALHTTVGIPPVQARFYLNGTERHVMDIPAKTTAIPTEVLEHNLSVSANAEIPGEIVQPGLEVVIEIDPDGTLDPGLGVAKRIPDTGRMVLDVRDMPVFDLTVIPFLWSADPDRAVVETAGAMEADPEGHELLWDTRTLLPIGDLKVTAHEPVLSSSNSKFVLLAETRAIRAMEGGTGHYMGMMSGPLNPGGGVASRPGRVNFSSLNASTVAHELGHNMSLRHAPCGNPNTVDPSFPHRDGSTGAWGYDFRDGGSLVGPEYKDLMSYCEPEWISDYHFANALRFRLFDERPPLVAATSLLLWGGLDAEGEPFLNPAFVVDAPPALPDSAGEHRIAGRTASGDELFALSFTMPEVVDGDGGSSFAFVLPAQPGWAGNLATLTLSGPGGSVTLDSDTDLPMTILLDPSTGQVRGILQDLPQADAAALAPQAGFDSLDVLFSRGIPDAAAWSR